MKNPEPLQAVDALCQFIRCYRLTSIGIHSYHLLIMFIDQVSPEAYMQSEFRKKQAVESKALHNIVWDVSMTFIFIAEKHYSPTWLSSHIGNKNSSFESLRSASIHAHHTNLSPATSWSSDAAKKRATDNFHRTFQYRPKELDKQRT